MLGEYSVYKKINKKTAHYNRRRVFILCIFYNFESNDKSEKFKRRSCKYGLLITRKTVNRWVCLCIIFVKSNFVTFLDLLENYWKIIKTDLSQFTICIRLPIYRKGVDCWTKLFDLFFYYPKKLFTTKPVEIIEKLINTIVSMIIIIIIISKGALKNYWIIPNILYT